MRITLVAFMLALAPAIAGCGGGPVRLDVTSEASLDASMKAMGEQLDQAGKDDLARAMTAASFPVLMKSAFNAKAPKPTKMSIFKPFHGMTAAEIIATTPAKAAPSP